MKKQQAREYFEQLKKLDKAKHMGIAQIINIITGGTIPLPKAQTFIQQTASNEFGAYAEIYDYLQQQDWRELEFEQIQAIIRCLKDHLKKVRLLTEPKDISQIDIKGMNTSSESKFQNKVEQAIANQSNKASIFFHDEQSEQFQYEQKWKHAKFKAVKKLLIIFDFIRKWMRVEGQSFEANQKLCEKLDLNLFMKYTKMFDLGSTFKPQKMIKSFKQNAVNQLWLDFDRFVNANLQLIGFRTATPAKEKYLRLRELLDLLSSQKIKKMLNIRNKSAVATIVEGHTGTYKQDILDYLKQKYDERRHRLEQKWKGKKLNTEPDQSRITTFEKGSYVNVSKVRSVKSLPKRAKTLEPISIHEELNLPKLRLKQSREQSIYKSLKQLDLRSQQAKVRQLVNAEQDEQYLQEYLKKEGVQKKRSKVKQAQELPRMKFT